MWRNVASERTHIRVRFTLLFAVGSDISILKSIYEPTEPSQPVMSCDVSEDTPQQRELRPLFSFRIVWWSLTSHRVICEQGLWDGTSGLSSLSEKTRKSNHLQMSLQRRHFLLSYFKRPWVLVRPGFELTTSRSADRRSTNWANRAAVKIVFSKIGLQRLLFAICAR